MTDALVVHDVNFKTGLPVTYHLCRTPGRKKGDDGACCDAALSAIKGADKYPHSGDSTNNG